MDKFEYQAKLEEIGKLVNTEDYEEAAQIADTIEWKRVRSIRTLCTVSEIYEAVGRPEDSKTILARAYRRSPNSRQILFRLTEVCVRLEEFDEAVEYYTEYVNLSPHDNNKYVLKYEIYKGRGSSLEEQIMVLEELRNVEYSERWAYELASLYDQVGMGEKCVSECNEMALWFRSGEYVVRALKLKQKYTPLTPEQQTLIENPGAIIDMETKEEVIEKTVPKLADEITKELPTSQTDALADRILMSTEKEIASSVTEHKAAEKEYLEDNMLAKETERSLSEYVLEVIKEKESETKATEEGIIEEAEILESAENNTVVSNVGVEVRENEGKEEADNLTESTEEELPETVVTSEEPQAAEVLAAAEETETDLLAGKTPAESEQMEVQQEGKTPKKKFGMFDPAAFQNEFASSMRQILSGLKNPRRMISKEAVEMEFASKVEDMVPSMNLSVSGTAERPEKMVTDLQELIPETGKPVDEPEKKTQDAETKEMVMPDTEEPARQVITEESILTAATINLGEQIRKRIGDASLREYAATKAVMRAAEEKLTQKPTEAPAEEPMRKKSISDLLKTEPVVPITLKKELPDQELQYQETSIEPEVIAEESVETAKAEQKADTWEIRTKEKDREEQASAEDILAEEVKGIMESAQKVNKVPVLEMPELFSKNKSAEEVERKSSIPEMPGNFEARIAAIEPIMQSKAEKKEIIEKNTEENIEKKVEASADMMEKVQQKDNDDQHTIDPMSYTRSGLDSKERAMLGFWNTIRGVDEQVDNTVTQIMRSALTDKTSASGNVLLIGDAGNGRTTLAISIAKIICRCKGLQSAKVAKIYAEDLNNRDIAQVIGKIAGGVLIIEEAGDLSDGTIAQLSLAMEFKTDALVVFLEDERRYLQELLVRNPKFSQKFDITLEVPMLTNDELVEFGKYYAVQNESVMEEEAVQALYDVIGAMQSPEQPVAILDVKEVMDKVIRKASKFSIGKIISSLTGKRYDQQNRIIIKANAFRKL